jgi:hypothetical protein
VGFGEGLKPPSYCVQTAVDAETHAAEIELRLATTQTRPMQKLCRRQQATGRNAVTSAVSPGHIWVQFGRSSQSPTRPRIIA